MVYELNLNNIIHSRIKDLIISNYKSFYLIYIIKTREKKILEILDQKLTFFFNDINIMF